ncbi:MAG: DUF2975 domain-containing protein [Paracoccaceae bacterium]
MTSRLPTLLYGATWAGLIALMVIMPIVLTWIVVSGGVSLADLGWAYPEHTAIGAPSKAQGLAALGIGLIPWVGVGIAGWHLQSLFQLFRDDRALSYAAAERIRKVGIWLVIVAISKPIVLMVQVLILTMSNPPGERSLTLALSFSEFGFLIAGGLMVVIGRALVDATHAVEETRGFV